MTSGLQPPFSGAPTPVSGVTGGPPVLGGQISNDPSSGNVVISPNPGNVLQIRKGNTPQALQVYEYFHTNTDYSRIALNSQAGGPFQLAVETAPGSVIRDLNINANGNVVINAANFNVPSAFAGFGVAATSSTRMVVQGIGTTSATFSLVVRNSAAANSLLVRDDGAVTVGTAAQINAGVSAGALGFFGSNGSSKITISGSRANNAAVASIAIALAAYGLVIDGTTA